jgi:hypothetical protein
MYIPILKFKITDYKEKEIPKKLFRKSKIVTEEESYEITLSYNIDEDRFYYEDENKLIPTKKDLSRSIIMIYDIYKRYEKFGFKDNFKVSENKLNQFLKNFFNCNNNESEIYLKKLIFGSQPVNLLAINSILNELEIDGVDFTQYYYFQYPRISFR